MAIVRNFLAAAVSSYESKPYAVSHMRAEKNDSETFGQTVEKNMGEYSWRGFLG
jgi:hypothetical protein